MARVEEKKVKAPHPLMQQGTPGVDIESDHIIKFTVFRMGGTGAPVHVETIDQPHTVLEPGDIRRLVGGGRYQIKALANGHTSGRTHCSVIGTTQYEWDGPPNVKAPPVSPYAQQPAPQPIAEQVSQNLPVVVSAIGTVATTVLGFLTESRNARAQDEARRREYDDNKRREEQADRERRDAKERAEAEERRAERDREAEERRQQWQREAEERRDRERVDAETKAVQLREDARLREQQSQVMLQALLNRRDPNDALVQTLLGRALERPPPPPTASEEAGKIIDAAAKLKELGEGGSDKDTMQFIAALANSPLLGSPVIQQALGRVLSIVGLHDKPQMPEPIVVPESAVTVAQIPEQIQEQPPPPEPPPVPVDGVSVGGPISLN